MTTSLTPSSISVISDDGKPTDDQITYFGRRARRDLHSEMLKCFLEEERLGLTKAELARRLERDPASITRWLGAPMNHTIETISALLLAMGYIPEFSTRKLSDLPRHNEAHDLVMIKPVAVIESPQSRTGTRPASATFTVVPAQ